MMAPVRALATLVLLVGLALAGCGGGDAASPPSIQAAPTDGDAASTPPSTDDVPADPGAGEESAASAGEVADICRVYRAALRGRWDDQRTREEVRALELTSTTALAWQADLVEGTADRSLTASRSVVDAALQLDQVSACEPLAGLVSLAESMRDAPDTFEP